MKDGPMAFMTREVVYFLLIELVACLGYSLFFCSRSRS